MTTCFSNNTLCVQYVWSCIFINICFVIYFFHWFNKYIFRTPRWESCHTDMYKGKWFINRIIFFAFSYCSIFCLISGRLVVGFTTTCAIKCLSPLKLSGRTSYMVFSIQHIWLSLSVTSDRSVVFFGYAVSSTNKTYLHDITETHHRPNQTIDIQKNAPCLCLTYRYNLYLMFEFDNG